MTSQKAILYAIAAALCYGISIPVSKVLLGYTPPTLMAAFLYLGAGLGAGVGTGASALLRKNAGGRAEAGLTRKEFPFVCAMIVLDIAAPVLLMFGLAGSNAETASLLNNFEIVATALVALLFFREAVGGRMWGAIVLITVASALLSVRDFGSLSLSSGSMFVLLACACWGVENNCTRMLSLKNPIQIVMVKGFGSGLGALILGIVLRESFPSLRYIIAALLLGCVSYGMSVYFYILAQRSLGAARTGAYYAFAPFIGAALSFALFRTIPTVSFAVASVFMIAGAYLAVSEKHRHAHAHAAVSHEHRHRHDDGHHEHGHAVPEDETGASAQKEHSHPHSHEAVSHEHAHLPDMHHTHTH